MERTYQLQSSKFKGKWECEKLSLEMEGDDDYNSSGLSRWPPKNYNCSFCKREFRSAQALGGHMNVHRRDRAKLRQLPSPVLHFPNPKLNCNSNPNSSSSRPSFKFLSSPYTRKSLVSSSLTAFSSPSSASANEEKKRVLECCPWDATTLPCEDLTKKKSMKSEFGAVQLEGHAQKFKLGVLEKENVVCLDLEIGLKDPKEVLDLELRLG
ncbi:hypothetical protein ACOSP7_001378 [Xanthoceras sorbifolium]|uniref:C2H2-type domain-containing protein n=1 Tax=Xanthoceras sorbifolium TaxID=99658 RepID=A0ABQ8IMA2_9ROSI|nr:hypothetical protein JRO89_XS01G0279900 [Xanthoceras sorbifolium]